eukprot:GILK01008963.1.p2 GENE.GILK01008963.1~~GILK01008963.1.p2  ORF type:complete len:118 (-),score=18.66 GILK01008963.1:461-814(-)
MWRIATARRAASKQRIKRTEIETERERKRERREECANTYNLREKKRRASTKEKTVSERTTRKLEDKRLSTGKALGRDEKAQEDWGRRSTEEKKKKGTGEKRKHIRREEQVAPDQDDI